MSIRYHIDFDGGIHSSPNALLPTDPEYAHYKYVNLPSYNSAILLVDQLKVKHDYEVTAEYDLLWVD